MAQTFGKSFNYLIKLFKSHLDKEEKNKYHLLVRKKSTNHQMHAVDLKVNYHPI